MPGDDTFNFLQFSDSLFDSGRGLKSLELSPSQRRERNEEALIALEDLFAAQQTKEMEAVICGGNLFDAEFVTSATIERLQKIFARLSMPIIIAPGQYDAWSPDSMYNQKALDAKGLGRWPSNVFIFSKPEYQTIRLPNKRSVSVTARPFQGPDNPLDFTSASPTKDRDSAVSIIISQAANLSSTTMESLYVDKTASSGFDYTAYSGYPNHLAVRGEDDHVMGAFAGTFFGQTEVEQGGRYALYCRVDKKSEPTIAIAPQEVDKRRVHVCAVSFANATPDLYLQRVSDSLKSTSARSRDIIVLKLFGAYASEASMAFKAEDLPQKYYHVKIEDRTRPNYQSAPAAPESTQARFIALVEEMRARFRTTSGDDSGSALSSDLIEDALYFGLAALREGKVLVRDAD